MDAFCESEGRGDDQIIEVDGWCHLPRFPVKSTGTTDKALQTCWGLPEAEVRVWGAQILLALESLHQQGILCRDLNPRNVLLTSNGEFRQILVKDCMWKTTILILLAKHHVFTGKVLLTFFGQWSEVQSEICSKAMEQMYCAPGTNMHYCELKPVVVPGCNLPPSGKIQFVPFILNKSSTTAHTVWKNKEMLCMKRTKLRSLYVDRNWWGVQGYRGL